MTGAVSSTTQRALAGALSAAAPLAMIVALAAAGGRAAPTAAFLLTVVLTAPCLVGAVALTVAGVRGRVAEIAILGAALSAASALPLVHGLTMPGILYGPNGASGLAAAAAVPAALAVGAPLLAPRSRVARTALARWRRWVVVALTLTAAASTALLILADRAPQPAPGGPLSLALVAVSLAGLTAVAARLVRHHLLSGSGAYLLAAVGIAFLASSTLAQLGARPGDSAWWLAHAWDGAGVLAATGGLLLATRGQGGVVAALEPLIARDPLAAIEVGVSPVVHAFVAALDRKDPATRDHVVRVAEMSLRLGVRAGYGPARLRALGLGALMHDVGKVETPDEILTKPGRLTAEEFERMKEHTVVGHRIVTACAATAPAAGIVRHHHERWDGGGYPDGLDGQAIPEDAALVGVCDAWDAMTHTRVYRTGMSAETARAILREGSGAQWCPRFVELALIEIDDTGGLADAEFARVGRERAETARAGGESAEAVLEDAIPEAARALAVV